MKTTSLFFRLQKRTKLLFAAIGVLAIASITCLALGASNLHIVKADESAEIIQMIGGASIRVANEEENRGLRFFLQR